MLRCSHDGASIQARPTGRPLLRCGVVACLSLLDEREREKKKKRVNDRLRGEDKVEGKEAVGLYTWRVEREAYGREFSSD